MKKPAILTAAAITAALLFPWGTPAASAATTTPAYSSAANPSVLDYLCGHGDSHGHPCAVLVQRQSGEEVLKVRDQKGRIHIFTSARAALRYLSPRVYHCPQEDSNACLWDADTSGNGHGDSFIVIGHGEWTHDRSLPQYGHGVLRYLGDLD